MSFRFSGLFKPSSPLFELALISTFKFPVIFSSKKVAEFRKAGVKVAPKLSSEQLAVLIELKQKDHKEYWLALHNFYVISRYNPRTLYTMAVVQLTEMIKEQYMLVEAGATK